MVITYAKTAAGQQEIESRARRLPPRARSLLILVDGKRSDAELAQLVGNSDETLKELLHAGLVAPVQTGPVAAAPSAPKAAPAAVDTAALRREAVRAITELLGPTGDSITMKIEKAADADALRMQLEKAASYIAAVRGAGAAAQFASRFLKDGG